jgi:hypothetical protein
MFEQSNTPAATITQSSKNKLLTHQNKQQKRQYAFVLYTKINFYKKTKE